MLTTLTNANDLPDEIFLQDQLVKESQEEFTIFCQSRFGTNLIETNQSSCNSESSDTKLNENQMPIMPDVITIDYFKKLVERVSNKNSQPLIGWKIKFTAEIAVHLINEPNQILGILQKAIITKPYFSRSGVYVFDAICNTLYSPTFINNTMSPPEKKEKEKERARFLFKVDTILEKLFGRLLEIDRKREQATLLRPTSKEENEKYQFSAKNKLWIQKLLNHWWKHKYFRKKTIRSIIQFLHLAPINEAYYEEQENNNKNKRKQPSVDLKSPHDAKRRKLNHENEKKVEKLNLLDLPNEILVKILSYLDIQNLLRLSTVNKIFRQITFDPTAWTNLKIIRQHKNKFTHDILKRFEDHLQCLEVLDLSYCHGINDESIQLFAKASNQVKFFSIEGCHQLSNSLYLSSFIKNTSHSLQHINLSLTTGYSFDQSLVEAIASCKKLTTFNFMNCSSLNGEMFIKIVRECKNLKRIDARCCIHLLSYLVNNHLASDTFSANQTNATRDIQPRSPTGNAFAASPSPSDDEESTDTFISSSHFCLSTSVKQLNFITYSDEASNQALHHFLSIHSFFSCLNLIFPSLELLKLNAGFIPANQETIDFRIEYSDAYCEVQASNLFLLQQFILKDENNLFMRGPTGKTLLSLAIECGSMEIIDYLFRARVNNPNLQQHRLYPENDWEKKIIKLSTIYAKHFLRPSTPSAKKLKEEFEFILKTFFSLMNIRAYGVELLPATVNPSVYQALLNPVVKLLNLYAADFYFIQTFFELATPVRYFARFLLFFIEINFFWFT